MRFRSTKRTYWLAGLAVYVLGYAVLCGERETYTYLTGETRCDRIHDRYYPGLRFEASHATTVTVQWIFFPLTLAHFGYLEWLQTRKQN